MSRDVREHGSLADVFGAVAGVAPSVPVAGASPSPEGALLEKAAPIQEGLEVSTTPCSPGVPERLPVPDQTETTPLAGNATKPFSIRLTASERDELERRAGGQPLGTYIRKRLLDGRAEKRRPQRRPKPDDQQIALVLAELGRSRLSSNLNQLAKAAHTGTLGTSAEVERELLSACAAVATMRDTLIFALGLRPEGGP